MEQQQTACLRRKLESLISEIASSYSEDLDPTRQIATAFALLNKAHTELIGSTNVTNSPISYNSHQSHTQLTTDG